MLGFFVWIIHFTHKPAAYRLIHQSNRRAKDLNSGFFMYELSTPTIESQQLFGLLIKL